MEIDPDRVRSGSNASFDVRLSTDTADFDLKHQPTAFESWMRNGDSGNYTPP